MIHRRFVTYHYTPISLVQGGKHCLSYLSSQHKPALLFSTICTANSSHLGQNLWLGTLLVNFYTQSTSKLYKPHNLLLNSFFNVTCIFLSCRICLLFLFVIIKTAWPVSPYGPDVFPKILGWHIPYRDPPLYREPTIYREIILYRGCIFLSNANFMFKCKILR